MLFFENKKVFLEALEDFETQTDIKVTDTNCNSVVGNEWGVNFVDVQINRAFCSFIEKHYTVVGKYYVKGRKNVLCKKPVPF